MGDGKGKGKVSRLVGSSWVLSPEADGVRGTSRMHCRAGDDVV